MRLALVQNGIQLAGPGDTLVQVTADETPTQGEEETYGKRAALKNTLRRLKIGAIDKVKKEIELKDISLRIMRLRKKQEAPEQRNRETNRTKGEGDPRRNGDQHNNEQQPGTNLGKS